MRETSPELGSTVLEELHEVLLPDGEFIRASSSAHERSLVWSSTSDVSQLLTRLVDGVDVATTATATVYVDSPDVDSSYTVELIDTAAAVSRFGNNFAFFTISIGDMTFAWRPNPTVPSGSGEYGEAAFFWSGTPSVGSREIRILEDTSTTLIREQAPSFLQRTASSSDAPLYTKQHP